MEFGGFSSWRIFGEGEFTFFPLARSAVPYEKELRS